MRHQEAYKFRKKNLNESHERANGKNRSVIFEFVNFMKKGRNKTYIHAYIKIIYIIKLACGSLNFEENNSFSVQSRN